MAVNFAQNIRAPIPRARYALIIVLLCMFLYPLQGFSQSASSADQSAIISEQIPDEIKLVLGAVMAHMRGGLDQRIKAPIIFSENALAGSRLVPFILDPFTMIGSVITDWGVRENVPPAIALDALLNFVDPMGRRATLSLVIDYMITKSAVEVIDVTIEAVPPPNPEVRYFFIPEENLPTDVFSQKSSSEKFHRIIKENAVVIGPEILAGPKPYFVLAYVVDRVRPNAEIDLRVTTKSDSDAETSTRYSTLKHDGWQIAVNKTTFAFNQGIELFFQTVYLNNEDDSNGSRATPQVLGVMSSYR